MSKALYRKYRSKKLDDVIGQTHITNVLARALQSGHISHAYLFTGPRGVGKTSVARIMAYAINELDYDETKPNLDIIEIDAASNNGVDDVRNLREKVQIAPVKAKKKIYIIDEVHMLSKPAFNALLKTLEEPPEHVVFILATTNIEKVPATIVSRTQRFSFRPIKPDDAVSHLADIAKKENIKISKEALEIIAQHGEGSFRDSISLLDQVSNLTDQEITAKLIIEMLGLAPQELVLDILEKIKKSDFPQVIKSLEKAFSDGVNANLLAKQISDKVYQQIADSPELIPLLDQLIEVEKSPKPQIKLISVIGLFTTTQKPINEKRPNKTAALLATTHELTASVTELKKEIKIEKAEKKIVKKTSSNHNAKIDLDWQKLLDYAHQNNIALYSVLSKCGYKLDGDNLTIYSNNVFYKKKLDSTKYSLLLHEYLQATGVDNINIHTLPTPVPPKSDAIAAIAAMMGGGEEVVLNHD